MKKSMVDGRWPAHKGKSPSLQSGSIVCILLLILIPALLNVPMKSYFHPPAEAAEQDLIYRMFGGLRGLLADWAFMKGEEYYHGGLPIRSMDVSHCMQEEMAKARGDRSQDEHEHEGGQQRKLSFYSKLYSQMKVTEHIHLAYKEEKEVLPWFYLQVKFNPHDIQGYVLGSYWLRRLGNTDEAFEFLAEGRKNNPESAQILMAMGEYYFRKKNYEEAIGYLECARQLWLSRKPPNIAGDNYTMSDRDFTFDLLGNLYEKKNQPLKAAQVYRELYSFNPTHTILLDKIKKLTD
jgi:tetratricopeptide (TPR) repeat protein